MFSRISKRGGKKRRRKRSNLGDSQRVEYRIVSLPNKSSSPISNKLLFFLAVTFHLITSQSNRYTHHISTQKSSSFSHTSSKGSSLGARISVVGHRRCVKAAPFRCSIFNKPRRLERVWSVPGRRKAKRRRRCRDGTVSMRNCRHSEGSHLDCAISTRARNHAIGLTRTQLIRG